MPAGRGASAGLRAPKTMVLGAWCLGLAGALRAEESASSLALPPLAADPPGSVALHACDVSIIADQVTVDLAVNPRAPQPALLLSGSVFGSSGPSDPHPEKQFPELTVDLDGAPAQLEDRFEAFAGGMNVTNLLESAGMDPWVITRTPPVTAAHTSYAPVLKALQNVHAIEKSGDGYLAKWTARRIVRVPLRESPEQRVVLHYKARPAVSVMGAPQLATRSRERNYCISPKDLKSWSRALSTEITVREYSISTSIDGQPATSVTLTLRSALGNANATDRWYFCGPRNKPVARSNGVHAAVADVDDSGVLHVLRLADMTPAP
jgi:hypothetical protein